MSPFRSSEYQNWKNNNRMSINISTESATPTADLKEASVLHVKNSSTHVKKPFCAMGVTNGTIHTKQLDNRMGTKRLNWLGTNCLSTSRPWVRKD